MRPIKVTQAATGVSNWIPMDLNVHFAVGIGCVINSGAPTYSVEHTFDDVQDPTVTPTAFQNSGITAQTTNKDGNYAFPVRAIRLNVTAGTGSVTMTLLQGLPL